MEKQDGLNQKRDVINNNKSTCILTFSKIYKLQKYIGYGKGSICANNAMVETCPFGEKCVNRHESVLNHEGSRSLVKGVKKLLTGDENYKKVNVTFNMVQNPKQSNIKAIEKSYISFFNKQERI